MSDNYFEFDLINNIVYCSVCDKEMKKGSLTGHKKTGKHQTNVEKFEEELDERIKDLSDTEPENWDDQLNWVSQQPDMEDCHEIRKQVLEALDRYDKVMNSKKEEHTTTPIEEEQLTSEELPKKKKGRPRKQKEV